jgi:hypothetical protein
MDTTLLLPTKTQAETSGKSLIAGIITGQVAGLIMAVVVMIVFTLFLGKGPLYPVQVIGSAVFGETALQGIHIGALLSGLILHQLGPSLLWGALFGLLASKIQIDNTQSALKFGLILGVISMAGPYLLIPFVMNTLQGVDIWNREVPMFWDWAAHLVFGASFALYPKIQGNLK